ncbi:MinD/ParA family ATP-binding protein [Actinomadura xylanilytica]|uniref:MinD/ParA family ATP-binding protein n=1 Tax=Actinomadura xylanilytica TaxID=887459 RepID=UPI00255B0214|nr:MinD/ParA family protein [Actinomadura xylanilytica]MDL4772849.1 MinD/ParA family protein [Actinomadura xylanilytica]
MSDSSWQQVVLRDLGASGRGLASLEPASPAPAHGTWGADAAPQPVAEPKPIEVPAEPHPAVPVLQPPAQEQPVPPGPDPFGPPPVRQDEAAAPEPAAPEPVKSGPPDPFGPPPVRDESPGPDPFGPPPVRDESPGPDPFGPPPVRDEPPAPAAPEPVQQQPQALTGNEPIMREGFSPEMAMAPIVGGAPPELGGAPPDLGGGSGEEPGADATTSRHEVPPAPAPPQPPGSVVPSADEFLLKNQHGDPLMRRVGLGLRRAVGGSGGAGFKDQAEIVELLRRPVPSYRQLAVVSVRGGAGKTTISALVASELARHRTDRVIAIDADAELGSLPLRLGVRAERSLFDLAGQQPRSFEEAAQFLTRNAAGLWVLSSSRGGRIAGEFTIDTFQAAVGALSRYVSAAVVDCGAGILTELHRGILATTHAQVLVTPGTVDGALSARGALEWFSNNGQSALLSRTVIAMVTHAPHGGADLDRAGQMLSSGGLPVVYVPYDRHLAVGGALDLTKVSEATHTAVTRVVAEVFARSFGPAGVAR